MKTTLIVAIVGVVAVLGIAGAAIASDTVAKALGMGSGTGHMHQWNHDYAWDYSGEVGDCPASHEWDYTWDYSEDYDYALENCTCA